MTRDEALEVRTQGDYMIVILKPKRILQEADIDQLGAFLYDCADHPLFTMVISFRNVEYVSTMFYSKLMTLKKKLRLKSQGLILCDVKPEVYETFEITRLNKVFTIVDDLESALQIKVPA